ncbi:hypothetical protein [Roseivirga thermotolerans]|nr:hypothetical protein [Roseivirga thermotolerans]
MKNIKIIRISRSGYKYRIGTLVKTELKGLITKEVCFIKELGIARSTYYRDKNIKMTDKAVIPEIRLQIYAIALGVRMDELLNYRVSLVEAQRATKRKEKLNQTLIRYNLSSNF